jgi:hypothetical protein
MANNITFFNKNSWKVIKYNYSNKKIATRKRNRDTEFQFCVYRNKVGCKKTGTLRIKLTYFYNFFILL